VHGTWGRGFFPRPVKKILSANNPGYWFLENSDFCKSLIGEANAKQIAISTRWLCWSGANSIFQRYQASSQLAESIRQEQKQHPNCRQVIIAHSHGGNVALRTLARLVDLERPPLLVTLATPFVTVVPAEISKNQEQSVKGTFFTAFLAALMIMWFPAWSSFNVRHTLFGLLIGIPLLGILLAIISPILGIRIDRNREFTARAKRIFEATDNASVIISNKLRILVLRAIDDEASLALAFGSIGNRLSLLASSIFFKVVTYYCWFLLVVLAGLWIFFNFAAQSWQNRFSTLLTDQDFALWQFVFHLMIYLLPAFCCGLLLLSNAFKAAYGRELLFGGMSYAISTHSAPDNSEMRLTIATLTTGERPSKLRHMIYDNPNCCRVIVSWIVENLDLGNSGVMSTSQRHDVQLERPATTTA
jgi:hypothetical protein